MKKYEKAIEQVKRKSITFTKTKIPPKPPLSLSESTAKPLCSFPESPLNLHQNPIQLHKIIQFLLQFNPMSIIKEPATPPPPTIGKMGPYTVFVTPSDPSSMSVSGSPEKYSVSPSLIQPPPVKLKSAPPVQPPPVQYHKSTSSKLGIFWDAVAKVQNVHSSLDEYVAHWFGLNQSKYQWALDDYYESNGVEKVNTQGKNTSAKAQSV